MKKWFLKLLGNHINWLSKIYSQYGESKEVNLPFNFLTPTNSAEKVEVYLESLQWALSNRDKIRNIAVTGPYGSGKSSVIQTFQEYNKNNSEYKFLNISLATFKEEINEDSKSVNQNDILRLIELSILQQLFYHEKDSKIPDSRFKKIKRSSGKNTLLWTMGIVIFFLTLFYLFFPEIVVSMDVLDFIDYKNKFIQRVSLLITIIGSTFLIFRMTRYLKGMTIRKFEISDASIEIDEKISKSILNNHIDEILYFFEVTDYNVVIIEDLDRFEQTEVFTKLREINLLINNSKKVEKDIVFVYAIRDDMFKDKNRTKFFDFLIPIIPVINSSNSNEKLLKIVRENEYDISHDLLEDVSLFIDDMRLLYNIMNEYYVYYNKLNQTLSQNKLLSIIVYKNIFPNDFTQLSQNEGELYKTLNAKPKYIEENINISNKSIEDLRIEIEKLKREQLNNIQELRTIYVSKIIEEINISGQAFRSFYLRNRDVYLEEATSEEFFTILRNNTSFQYVSYSNGQKTYYKYDFGTLEKKVNPNLTYNEREKLILGKGKIEENKKRIEKIEKSKIEIKKMKLKDIIDQKIPFTNTDNKKQQSLITLMLRSGYIDEDYLDYISIFYEGSLSKTDNQFLINVKTQQESDYDIKLNQIENLIKKINVYEFEKQFVLNFSLIDFIVNSDKHIDHAGKLFSQLSNESEISVRFIDEFIQYSSNIENFIIYLCQNWANIWDFISTKSNYTIEKCNAYFKMIVEYADISDIKRIFQDFSDQFASNPDFLTSLKDKSRIERILSELDVKFIELNEKSPSELLEYVYEGEFYKLNVGMIKFWLHFKEKFIIDDFESRNYSAIKESKLDRLIEYVDSNINDYVVSAYLKMEDNISEDYHWYVELLNHDALRNDHVIKIIDQVETQIEDITLINKPEVIKFLLRESKVGRTWDNIIAIFMLNEYKMDIDLQNFINDPKNANELSEHSIKSDIHEEIVVKHFIQSLTGSNDVSNECYNLILKSVPVEHDSLVYDKLEREKVEMLINHKLIETNPENFEALRTDYDGLHIALIENNTNEFLEDIENYLINKDDLLAILKSEKVELSTKEKMIDHFDVDFIQRNHLLKYEIGKLLLRNSNMKVDPSLVKKIGIDSILNVAEKIRLYLSRSSIYDHNDLYSLIDALDEPYSNINIKGKRPLLENTELNLNFVNNLKERNYISKYDIESNGIRISTFRK